MARKKQSDEEQDIMANAPAPRPYAEAVTEEHRQVLQDANQWREPEQK